MTTQTVVDRVASEFLGKEGRIRLQRLAAAGIDALGLVSGYVDHCKWGTASDKLLECSETSHRIALRQCLRLGLWPGPAQHIYVIPRAKQAMAQVGYRGLITLMKRHSGVTSVESVLVYKGEPFSLVRTDKGTRFRHETVLPRPSNEVLAVYARAHFVAGPPQIEVMDVDQVREIREKHGNAGTWAANVEEMTRKTAIHRLAKYVGMDEQLAAAFQLAAELDLSTAEPRNVTPRKAGTPTALLEMAQSYAVEAEEVAEAEVIEA